MNQEKFTLKSRNIIEKTIDIANKHGNQEIKPLHLLHSIIKDKENIVSEIVLKAEADKNRLLANINKEIEKMPKIKGGEPYIGRELKEIFQESQKIASQLSDKYISTEHFIIALLKKDGASSNILKQSGINEEIFLKLLKEFRKDRTIENENPEENTYSVLEKYTHNLVEKAQKGEIDPVIGRDDEIRRVMEVLIRRRKNNPLLVGDAGVGKTAIAEGIALRIAQDDVPQNLKGKKILALDLAAMIAGAKYRGEFEERLKSTIKEIEDSQGKIILFIDEVHTIVGAGANEGNADAANILKPALARGTLHTIGATTLKEYKLLEKDPALARRFQRIIINEPNVEQTISILRGLKDKYEIHHGVKISDKAIIAACKLSDRYIQNRHLPDKAIDLMDEACAHIRIQIDSSPEEMDKLQRNIIQLELEIQSLKSERGNKETLKNLKEKLENEKIKFKDVEDKWLIEKKYLKEINESKKRVEEMQNSFENAKRKSDFEYASKLQHQEIPREKKKIEELENNLKSMQSGKNSINEIVNEKDIAMILSKWTKIPSQNLLKEETQKYLNLEKNLKSTVIGQDKAIEAISAVIKRSVSNINNPNRPLGTFLFLGPTGVGKTYLVKELNRLIFPSEKSLIRLDMSEYMERHSVAKLIGSPPGYIGYNEGGQLTERVKNSPYSLILLDEIEKAHPEVLNILLQLLDEGHLSESKGETVNFKNTLIVMTSNIASKEILEGGNCEEVQEACKRQLHKYLKPEFINRIDGIISFNSLSVENIEKIVQLRIAELNKRLESHEITISADGFALKELAKRSYQKEFGARPLNRVIIQEIEDPLADGILRGKFKKGDNLIIKEDLKIEVTNKDKN